MRKKTISIIYICIIAILSYVCIFLINNMYSEVLYKILLTCIVISASLHYKSKKVNMSSILIIIINLLSIFPILLNSNTASVYLSNYIYICSLIFLIIILNTKDYALEKKYKDAEIYLLLVFPLVILSDILKFIINIKGKKINNKDEKIVEKDYEVTKKSDILPQVILGLTIGIPVFFMTLIFLSFIEVDFLKIFNLSVINSVIYSIFLGFLIIGLIYIYNKKERKYNQFIIETVSRKRTFVNYKLLSNIILLSTLPLQSLFVIYEFSKLLLPLELYGQMVADAFTLINCLVIGNIILLTIFYFFYAQKDTFSKLIRIIFVIVNYMLLIISLSQIVTYINNFNALTPKRYYGLITIIIIIMLNSILFIKILNKNFAIKNLLYLFMIILIILTMCIDSDSVIYKYNTSQTLEKDEELDINTLNSLYPIWYVNEYNVLDD